ncbi:anti-sigma-I factor RsgI family protein [Ornithinibacillus halophilus]|uniref:RsgI N-terminal anti-sigma domain-containing protein n=1 Tax=Ornithinibacillus halophilus TaxID=930117 RepID=A0A1M5LGL2_9BACI|nr:hypothetical protein [Ornithinibacillus halophilus]SHG64105.1 hypothetical protein SAMN05216225_104716 [Ornithinibacillus halophilus]
MKKQIIHGTVVKVTKKEIVLLTKEGQFKNIPCKKGDLPLIGSSYTYEKKSRVFKNSTIRNVSVAAIFFIAMVSYLLFSNPSTKDAYLLAVDINPSIEIFADEEMEVTHVKALNIEGESLIEDLTVDGNLNEVLKEIIHLAVQSEYFSVENENVIALSAISLNNKVVLDGAAFKQTIKQTLAQNKINSDVTVQQSDEEELQEARKIELSVNKYKMYKELENHGKKVNASAVRGKSIATLMKDIKQSENKVTEDEEVTEIEVNGDEKEKESKEEGLKNGNQQEKGSNNNKGNSVNSNKKGQDEEPGYKGRNKSEEMKNRGKDKNDVNQNNGKGKSQEAKEKGNKGKEKAREKQEESKRKSQENKEKAKEKAKNARNNGKGNGKE